MAARTIVYPFRRGQRTSFPVGAAGGGSERSGVSAMIVDFSPSFAPTAIAAPAPAAATSAAADTAQSQ
jgi:hypothetical protein